MKKVISSLLVMSVMFCASIAKADNVTVEQAKAIGAYYMAYQTGIDKLTPDNLTLSYQFENPDMNVASAYVFSVSDCGWIIIAGSSVVEPVIAFSEEGVLDMTVIPDNLRWWLTSYTGAIAEIQVMDAENDYPNSESFNTLLKLATGSKSAPKANQKILLMDSHWSQGSTSNPTYNMYCPMFNGRYSVSGCVATALSQICRYYNYPVKPKGTVSTTLSDNRTLSLKLDTIRFDYSLMPKKLVSSSTTAQIKEVAKLTYSVGLAVHMDYDPDGSAATMESARTAMKTNFKYNRGTNIYRKANLNPDTAFINNIRRHLVSRDVLCMSGASSTGGGADAGGHAWVVCGYQTEDTSMYYMNWGWGGSGDGWYNLVTNNMSISGMGYNFNVQQSCLFYLIPPEDSNIHHPHQPVGIREVENSLLGTAYPNPATLSVSLPYTTSTVADMEVYGIDGKLIATERVQPGSGVVTLKVDALPKGIYIYRMNSQSGKFIVR